jgi:hypothetical protein
VQDNSFLLAFLRKHADKTTPEAVAMRADVEAHVFGTAWDGAGELMRGWILATCTVDPTAANAGTWSALPADTRAKLTTQGATWVRKLQAAVVVAPLPAR